MDTPAFRRRRPVRWFDPPELAHDLVVERRAHRRARNDDTRERRAAADSGPPIETLDLSGAGEVCFDHVADTGDGFGTTYSVASLLARPTLVVTGRDGQPLTLPGAELVVCGGDQVYAHPYGRQYDDRFVGPLAAAAPAGRDGPDRHLLAIPGDHDWWDGLEGFGRVFCGGASIGAWRTVQRRTYFSVRLPAEWWLWGIDPGLGGHLDAPQVAYFEAMADRAAALAGDREARLVIVVPAPGWLEESEGPALAVIEDMVVRRPTLRIVAMVAGDKHFYARHQPEGSGPVRFVNGRGGAFTYPTDRVPEEIAGAGGPGSGRARLAAVHPTADASRRARRRVLFAGRRQGTFAALTAALYLAWLPARTRRLVGAGLVAGAAAFVRGRPLPQRLRWGVPHALAHLAVMTAAQRMAGGPAAPGWRRAAGLAAAGAGLGPLVLGAYLLAAGQAAGINDNEAFSAIGEQGYKGFVRFHLDRQGVLRAYAVGLDRTVGEDDWEAVGDGAEPGEPLFRTGPGVAALQPRLVDDVVTMT